MDGFVKHLLETTETRDMSPEIAMDAGIKFGNVYKNIAVFRDTDPSSEMICSALVSGLLAAGCNVTYAGIVPTPLAINSLYANKDCILSVGNPNEDGKISGIHVYHSDGAPFSYDEIHEVIRQNDIELPSYNKVNSINHVEILPQKYLDSVKNLNRTSQGYVIIDCGCGSTSQYAPQILTGIGAEVVAFNTHRVSGPLPRSPNLDKTHLTNISNFVNASIGSVGIAFNGDGTRIALMDESGKHIPGDKLLAIILMYLEPTIAVVPFDSPCVVEDAFRHPLGLIGKDTPQEERQLIRTRNDLGEVIATMKETGADIGALNDGTFIFSSLSFCPDAIYTAVVLSELAGKRSIRNVINEIPIYSSRTVRIDFDGNLTRFGNKLMEKIKEYDILEVSQSHAAWKMILKKGTYVIKQSERDRKKLIIIAESSDTVYLITMLEQAKDIINFCI